jgi:hypothetical protein
VKLAASRELHSYWNFLRSGRSAPERSEIDPGAIRGVLADTFILEVDASGRYPIRIAGARTNSLFARELKGAPFLDLWQVSEQAEVGAILESVASETIAVLAGAATRPLGLQPLDFEILLLPLRHHGNLQARILGAVSPTSLPSWMGLLPAAPMSLLSFRVLVGAKSAPATAAPAPIEALGVTLDFGRMPHVDRRGHLFVVTGGSNDR